jgi:hypothetical protein
MAYLIRSLINLYLNVCRCAATTWNAKLNKSLKMVSLLAKIVFMSKYLGSCSNETQKFGIYKEGQKIPHELRSRCQLNYIDSYLSTENLLLINVLVYHLMTNSTFVTSPFKHPGKNHSSKKHLDILALHLLSPL